MFEGADCDDFVAATDGVLIVHDVLEHSSADTIGAIGHELEALAAEWWIRGSLGRLNRNGFPYPPAEQLASEITRIAVKVICNSIGFGCAVTVTRACIYDEDFHDILCLARKQLRKEVDYRGSINQCTIDTCFEGCLMFLRSGYRQTAHRYRRLGQLGANDLFWSMVECINRQLKLMGYPGQRVKVMYCLTWAEVTAELIENFG